MKDKQKYTPVRFSHLTSYASIGAIVRGVEDKLMVVRDTRNWTDKFNYISAEVIPYVTRVCLALGLDKELRLPPIAKEIDKGEIQGSYLSAVLFPTYAVCQTCGLLHNNPWRKQDVDYADKVKCEKCDSNLEQVTWCAASDKGYLDDVPWHYMCHLKSDKKCHKDNDSTYLKLLTNIKGNRVVKCTKCGSEGSYENMTVNVMNRQQPWVDDAVKLDKDDIVVILEVNNPGVYFPERSNAIVIPPESRISKSSVIDKLYNNSKLCREIDSIKIPLRKKGKMKEIASLYRCSIEDIKEALAEIKTGYPFLESNITVGELMGDEYKALLTSLENVADDEDFVTVHKTKDWKNLDSKSLSSTLSAIVKIVDKQVIVARLREIQVFKGFYRITQDQENLVPPDIVGESKWLPAIELFGEGIFFTLDEGVLNQWEEIDGVKKRTEEIINRYETSEDIIQEDIAISSRFILLHTLAHLLIRELETTAGYPAAALKERIYCSRQNPDNMAGILIFTAVADIVGSLGGIVESGEPKEFLGLMSNVFKHAQWCSLDPVCTEHEGQGPGWLNRAACHACALIPEPSCEYKNVLLDRVFIKGNESLGIPAFLNFVMEYNNG